MTLVRIHGSRGVYTAYTPAPASQNPRAAQPMPTLKDIRGRLASVRNITQITRAMEMVAASRMKRAQDSILAARPYADELEGALSRVAGAAGLSEEIDPLLARRPIRRVAIIVITTDRGLAGSLNANSPRAVLRWVAERASEVEIE